MLVPAVLAGLAVLLWLRLPGWVEGAVARELDASGLEVRHFEIERVGIGSATVAAGGLGMGGPTLEWRSLRVEYRLHRLLRGRLDSLTLEEPVIDLDWSLLLALMPPPGDAESVPLAVQLQGLLGQIPLLRMAAEGGRLNVALPGGQIVPLQLDAVVLNLADRASGQIDLAGEGIAARFSLTALPREPSVNLQAVVTIEEALLTGIVRIAVALGGHAETAAGLTLTGPLQLEALVEASGTGAPRASAEAVLPVLRLAVAGAETVLEISAGLVAATFDDGVPSVQAGFRVGPLQAGGLQASSFAVQLGGQPAGAWSLETERIDWQFREWSGQFALRGSGVTGDATRPAGGRIEAAFASLAEPAGSIEPFSLLLQGDASALALTASPVGWARSGTLWIEDLAARIDLAGQTANGGFTWYNTAGAHMGSLTFAMASDPDGGARLNFGIANPAGEPFLAGAAGYADGLERLTVNGVVPLSWVNALNRWWGALPAAFSGPNPPVRVALARIDGQLQGSARLTLRDTGAALDNGTALQGIEGDWEWVVADGLPRTTAPQLLRIRTVRGGEMEARDVEVEWQLDGPRLLRVNRFTARAGSGLLAVDPFSIDPLSPTALTRVHIRQLDASDLLDLMGERRFALEGSLTGSLGIGWDAGTLLVGQGSLRSDGAPGATRFQFVDKEFLSSQFSALGAIPFELKDLVLEALLREGIRIGALEVRFRPADKPGHIALSFAMSGETRTERLELPIRGFVIHNIISEQDLGYLLGLLGPVRVIREP